MKSTKASTVRPLEIYYDGLCHLCSREIDHYRLQEGSENLVFIDITNPDFKPEALGLNPFAVNKWMHSREVGQQEWFIGVDTFIAIWERLPKYGWLAKLAKKFWVRPVLDLGYESFALIRPYLPKKVASCETSPYCEIPTDKSKGN